MMDTSWLDICVTAGEWLYGEYPVEVLKALYETGGEKISTGELLESLDAESMMVCDGEMIRPVIVTEGDMLTRLKEADAVGNPYASIHFDPEELQTLQKEVQTHAADVEYWMPTAKQIRELVENGYIRTKEMTACEKTIMWLGGDPIFIPAMWGKVSTGKISTQDALNEGYAVIKACYDYDSDDVPSELLNSDMQFVRGYLNSVNRRDRKGWPPEELERRQHPELSLLTSLQAGRAYGVKVGRNEPCPCGSGKKFKNCHGR